MVTQLELFEYSNNKDIANGNGKKKEKLFAVSLVLK